MEKIKVPGGPCSGLMLLAGLGIVKVGRTDVLHLCCDRHVLT